MLIRILLDFARFGIGASPYDVSIVNAHSLAHLSLTLKILCIILRRIHIMFFRLQERLQFPLFEVNETDY